MINLKSFTVKCGLAAALYFLSALISVSAEEIPDQGYAQEIAEKALAVHLYEDPYWKLLLHYKKGINGESSIVDDDKFFFSPEGKTRADLEMEATILAFFEPVEKFKQTGTMHPALKFPGRYFWLSEKLDIDQSQVPVNVYDEFDSYFKRMHVERAVLIFSAGYLGSPASMFGHTFLVLEGKNQSRLTALSVNYAAKADDSFGPLFAVKGLFGLYDGFYSFSPYYEKINEYGFGEMRNLWEYELNFSDEELRSLFRHLIDLENISSDYKFLSENCSYNLMFLLEAARPSVRLTDRFPFVCEPVDTVRAACEEKIIAERSFRPSLYAKMMHRSKMLPEEESDKAVSIGKGADVKSFSWTDDAVKGQTLDLAVDYLQFLLQKGELTQEDYSKRLYAVLAERSSLKDSVNAADSIPEPQAPEDGHLSSRVYFKGGFFDGRGFLEGSWRLSCHELMDHDFGVPSEYSFLKFQARYYPESRKTVLENFDFVSIFNLSPFSKFYFEKSWKVRVGAGQVISPSKKEVTAATGGYGTGICFNTGKAGFLYFLAGADVYIDSQFSYCSFIKPGISAGLVTNCCSFWKSHIFAEACRTFWGDVTNDLSLGTEQAFYPADNFSVALKCSRHRVFRHDFDEISVSASMYF